MLMYKTEVIPFTKDAEKRAQLIEAKANEMDAQGFELINTVSTYHGGVIATFAHVEGKTTSFTYQSIHLGFASSAEKRAMLIDNKANEMEAQGYTLVTVAATHHGGAILTFRK